MTLPAHPPLVSVPLWILAFGFAIFGPLMALAPRYMPGAIVLAALTLLPLLITQRGRLQGFFSNRILWLAVVAVAYSCASANWSVTPHPLRAAVDLGYLSLCTLLLAAEVKFVPQKMRELYLLLFALSAGAGFLVMAEEFLLSHLLYRFFNGMGPHDFVNDNVTKRMVGLFSLALWPVAAWLDQKRGRIWGFAVVAGFMGFSLIATSRAASLGMVMGFTALLIAYVWPKLMRWVLIAFLALGLVCVIPGFYSIDHLPDKAKNLMFGSAQYRLKIWQYTARHVPEAPVFGHGLDSSRGIQTTTGPEGLPYIKPGTSSIAQHPHNIFLQLWLDLGGVGVVLWGALMLLLALRIRSLPLLLQPYALGGMFCSIGLLGTTYSILQAWWASAHITAALMLLLAAQSSSRSAVTNGASAGGMAKPLSS